MTSVTGVNTAVISQQAFIVHHWQIYYWVLHLDKQNISLLFTKGSFKVWSESKDELFLSQLWQRQVYITYNCFRWFSKHSPLKLFITVHQFKQKLRWVSFTDIHATVTASVFAILFRVNIQLIFLIWTDELSSYTFICSAHCWWHKQQTLSIKSHRQSLSWWHYW
jgi:hypothetical protein